MFDLVYPTSVAVALKGAERVVLLAPERRLKKGWIAKAVDARWTRLLAKAARETAAGPTGKSVYAQNPDAGPDHLVLGVLPDERSRNNCPARPEAAFGVMKGAGADTSKTAVIACVEDDAHALPLARAVGRALPMYTRATDDGKPRGRKKGKVAFVAAGNDGKRVNVKPADRAVVDRARWAASLVDTPAADMTTTDFVRVTRNAARGIANLRVSVISGPQLLKLGMGGLHAVGRTAMQPPRLLLLDYRPPKATRRVALIGKGIVYDTGGLDLKTGGHMSHMKMDMGGAAATVGAALALAASKHKDAVICAAALAENAIGPDAYRPDDILSMHSGHTVEINNTDAEGRLVLADAASYVARKYKPDALLDMATLTGAQLISTGVRHAAVVSNRDGLEAAALSAGRQSGDLTSPLPFAPEFFQQEFASKVADMKNSVANRMNAQSSCAAQFVYSHIDDLDVPWVHVDIAGPAFREERGTGYGVALIAVLLRNLTKKALSK